MAINIGTAIAYLELDATRFTTGLSAVQSSLSQYQTSFSSAMTGIGGMFTAGGTALTTGLTVPIVNFGQSSVQAARDFESAFAGVKKTIDDKRFNEFNLTWDDLAQGIKNIAYETGISAEEIAGIMEIAGQLGVELGEGGKGIIEFTRQMALMGVTTDMSAADAALSLARFMNITGTTNDEVGNLTASIVDLGNNFATQEEEIVRMATRLASAGTMAGLTSQEILALSTAMTSAGIKAEAGASSMSTVLSQLTSRVIKYGQVLDGSFEGTPEEASEVTAAMETIADVADTTAEDFYKVWTKKPIEGLTMLIKGMATAEERGDNAILQLDELGFKSIRQSNMLRALALSFENMSDAVNTSNTAWGEATAMEVEAAKRFETLDSRINMLQERWKDLKRDVAEFLIPALEKLMDVVTKLIDAWKGLSDEEKKGIVKFAEIAAAVGPVMAIFGRIMTTVGQLIPLFSMLYQWVANVGEAITLYKAGWTAMAGEASGFGKAIASVGTKLNWIVAIIALVITAIVDLWKNSQSFRDKVMAVFQQIWDFLKQLWAALKPVFDELGALWMELARSIEPIVELLVDLLGPALEGLTAIIIPIVKIVAEILVLITKIVTYAVKVLAPVIRFLVEILGGGLRVINEILSAILKLVGYGLTKLAEGIQWIVDKFTSAEDTIVGMWTQNWTFINDTLHTNTDNIVNFIQNAVDIIIALNESMWDLFWSNTQEWWEVCKKGWNDFWDNVEEIARKAGEAISSWFKNAWSEFTRWIEDKWRRFTSDIKDGLDSFVQFVKRIGTSISDTAKKVVEEISNFATQAWDSIKEGFERVKQAIIEGITNCLESLRELGTKLVEGFTNLVSQIKGHFDDIMSRIKEIGSNLVSAFKSAFDKVGEAISNVFENIKSGFISFKNKVAEVASNVGKAFIDGLLGTAKNVKEFFVNFITEAINALKEAIPKFFEVGKNIMEKLWDGIKSKWEDFKKWFTDLWNSLLDGTLFKNIGGAIKNFFVNGSHENGLSYVPFNGYVAELHKGERVLTAEENEQYSNGKTMNGGTVINFYSNEKIDEYTAAKELRRTVKDIELGLV